MLNVGSKEFENDVVVVTGGAGSFGKTVVRHALSRGAREVRVFSRDEGKHDAMRHAFAEPRLRFVVGDVRDRDRVAEALTGADTVFHAAALKQVPACEQAPIEAVRTNVLGTEHVVKAAVQCGVRTLVTLSTDKAVQPINAMGMTKALVEKVVQSVARDLGPDHRTRLLTVRYGNVVASRGSVVPVFMDAVLAGRPISVTDPSMTRFLMTLDESVSLIDEAIRTGAQGDTFVRRSPAGTVAAMADAVKLVLGRPDHPIELVGRRLGEKVHESLATRDELERCTTIGACLRIPAPEGPDSGKPSAPIESLAESLPDGLRSDTAPRMDAPAIALLLSRQRDLASWLTDGRRVRIDVTAKAVP